MLLLLGLSRTQPPDPYTKPNNILSQEPVTPKPKPYTLNHTVDDINPAL